MCLHSFKQFECSGIKSIQRVLGALDHLLFETIDDRSMVVLSLLEGAVILSWLELCLGWKCPNGNHIPLKGQRFALERLCGCLRQISIVQNLRMASISHSKVNDPIYNMCVDSRPSSWPISPRSFIWHISPLISSLNLDQGIKTHSWCTNTCYGTLSWPLSRKNSALLGTLPRLELCLGWNFTVHGTLPRLELCLGWKFAMHGTLPRLELCLGWNFA